MKLCSKNHQRIVYEPFTLFGPEYAGCPLCTAMAEIERYQREIEAYRKLESAVSEQVKEIRFEGVNPS
jgi:hypothetical protein